MDGYLQLFIESNTVCKHMSPIISLGASQSLVGTVDAIRAVYPKYGSHRSHAGEFCAFRFSAKTGL